MKAAINGLESLLSDIDERIGAADRFITEARKGIASRKKSLAALHKDRDETSMAIDKLRKSR